VIGDDIKSQVGATITHRVLTNLFKDRGVHLDRTYQLNFGGNMDFYNMLERERLESKKISKTNAVTSQLPYELGDENVHVGPSDYVPWLTDRKWCHIRMEGRAFGDVPLQWRSSWRSGTRPTRPASSSTRCAAPSWPWIAACPARSWPPPPTS
jgi:myo-inositol-1-phosphate synthase